MKAFLAAVVVGVAVAFGAAMVLETNFQSESNQAFATEGARVDIPGTNLVQY